MWGLGALRWGRGQGWGWTGQCAQGCAWVLQESSGEGSHPPTHLSVQPPTHPPIICLSSSSPLVYRTLPFMHPSTQLPNCLLKNTYTKALSAKPSSLETLWEAWGWGAGHRRLLVLEGPSGCRVEDVS